MVLIAPIEEIRWGRGIVWEANAGGVFEYHDDSFGIIVGKWAKKHGAQCREDGCIRPDSKREGADRYEGKCGRLAEETERILKIGDKARHASYYPVCGKRLHLLCRILECESDPLGRS